jgi:hypothetical protein
MLKIDEFKLKLEKKLNFNLDKMAFIFCSDELHTINIYAWLLYMTSCHSNIAGFV